MKKITLILLLAIISTALYAQKYHHFPDTNVVWNTLTTGSMVPPYEWETEITLGNKFTYNGFEYRTILFDGTPDYALREDTATKKVYYLTQPNQLVLYDFNLQVGDSIKYAFTFSGNPYYKVVDSIDTILIGTEYRKRWYFTNSWYGTKDIWIEGIGSVSRYGLLEPLMPDVPTDNSITYFGCFKHDTVVYINDSACANSCPCASWLVYTEDVLEPEETITCYPNPSTDVLNIHFTNPYSKQIEISILSLDGKILQKAFNPPFSNLKISTSGLEAGIYFIHIQEGSVETLKKFVKVE